MVFGSMLFLVIGLMAGNSAVLGADDDKEIKQAQKDVLDLVKMITDGKDVSAKAAEIKKKYEDLNTVMHIYKPSPKGGIGYGKPNAGDGIEMKVIALGSKKALAAAVLSKEKQDLIRMARINLAMAEITMHYAPAKPKGGKGAKEWKQYTTDMKKAAGDLAKAAEAGNSAKVKDAANNLNNACNNCHSDFRDS
jgi:hypothetical protein